MKRLVTNSSLLVVIGEGFSSRLSFGLVSFALPLYALHLGLSLSEIGFLIALNAIIALIFKSFTGRVVDRFGLRRSLATAIGLRSVVALALAFAAIPWQLFGIRALQGVSESLRNPAVNVLLAEHGGKKAVASAFAWYGTAKSMAGALGKAAAGILLTLTASNFSLIFLVSFVLSALPLFVVMRYVKERRTETTSPVATLKPEASVAERARPVGDSPGGGPAVLPFMGLGFLISATTKMLHGLFPVLATQYAGLSAAEAGLIYLASTAVILVSGPLFGWLSDNVSGKAVLLVRSIANIVSSVCYLVAPNLAGVATGKIVDDIGKAAFNPAWGSLMAYVASFDRKRRARTMSLMSMGDDAGEIVGPILTGLLWSTWGIVAVFGVRIGLAAITEVYALILAMRLPSRLVPARI